MNRCLNQVRAFAYRGLVCLPMVGTLEVGALAVGFVARYCCVLGGAGGAKKIPGGSRG